jgi:UDP-N-acetylmuramoyl-L-alanyl-D-glutamate--2,6-diaminopimelate ligase
MRLGTLLADMTADYRGCSPDTDVAGLVVDSRRAGPGLAFLAVAGLTHDGHDFVAQAASAGATVLLLQAGRVAAPEHPHVWLADTAAALPVLAARSFGAPAEQLRLAGVTGTNGKTTVTYLVAAMLTAASRPHVRLGTAGNWLVDHEAPAGFTTPFPLELQALLAQAVARGASDLVMEVSSHALAQGRVRPLRYHAVGMTSFSQDHLDFHGTMERYGAEKARLFSELLPRCSVINVDDAFGRELAAHRVRGELITVGQRSDADIQLQRAELSAHGIFASLAFHGRFASGGRKPPAGGSLELRSRLLGEHNLDNLLLALGILVALDFPAELAAGALGLASAAPGRLERCDGPGDELMVVVDYAHTPDALSRVLRALRSSTGAKLWCVFGCGGDRDPGKRPKMGRAVAELADVAVVTNDNPRGEAPEKIVEAILPPLRESATEHRVVLDRALAIEQAVLEAAPGDCILIAGKGHENYQIFASGRTSFDDRVEARRALALRRERSELLAVEGAKP